MLQAPHDPYFDWLKDTDGAGFGLPAMGVPLVFELPLEDSKATALLNQLRQLGAHLPLALAPQIRSAHVPRAQLEAAIAQLKALKLRWELGVGFATGGHTRWRTAKPQAKPAVAAPKRSTRPVIAIIDHGLAFASPRFWRQAGKPRSTRVAAFWDQEQSPSANTAWLTPHGMGYGRELTPQKGAQALDDLLAGASGEQALYRALGHHAAIAPFTHGAHMADLAAATRDPLAQVDPRLDQDISDADIVMVQLPREVAGRTVSGLLRAHVLDALAYLNARVGQDQHLIVNLSYGANAGPHNGDSLLELAIDTWLAERRASSPRAQTNLVVAAGNWHAASMHAQCRIKPKQTQALEWINLARDPSDSFVELWLDAQTPSDANAVQMVVHSPDGRRLSLPQFAELRAADGALQAALYAPQIAGQSGTGRMALLAVGPTTRAWAPHAPAGLWRIELHNRSNQTVTANLWCERDDPFGSNAAGPRQARFVGQHVERSGTLSSLGHGALTTVVGACRARGGAPEVFASEGSAASPRRSKKNAYGGISAMAPSSESAARPGIAAAGTEGQSQIRLDGSSVSAAVASRALMAAALRGAAPAASPFKPGISKRLDDAAPRWRTL